MPGSAWLIPGRVCTSFSPSALASSFSGDFSVDCDCASGRSRHARCLICGLGRRDEGVGCVLSSGVVTGESVPGRSGRISLCWMYSTSLVLSCCRLARTAVFIALLRWRCASTGNLSLCPLTVAMVVQRNSIMATIEETMRRKVAQVTGPHRIMLFRSI